MDRNRIPHRRKASFANTLHRSVDLGFAQGFTRSHAWIELGSINNLYAMEGKSQDNQAHGDRWSLKALRQEGADSIGSLVIGLCVCYGSLGKDLARTPPFE
jgi:hypothetical protein